LQISFYINTFGLTIVELTLFIEGRMDTSRPSHYNGTNFPYLSARMACYLEVIDLRGWRATHDEMKPLKNPKKHHDE